MEADVNMKFNVKLSKYFSDIEMETLAKKSGLVIRESSITGQNFGLTFTLGLLNTTNATLKQLAAFLNNNCNENISPQALDQKIDEHAVEFMKMLLIKAIEISIKKIEIPNALISFFSHIYIIDSTNFDLHPSLKEKFKGSGGSASASSMRIQFIFDYLTGKLLIEIGDVRTSDSKTLEKIVSSNNLDTSGNTLYLQDLGYFNTDTFITISNSNDFFISKLKFKVKIYDMNGNEIDILKLIRRKPKSIDIMIQLGDLKCRLVGNKLSKKLKNQRIEGAESDAKKKGRNPISKEYKIFLSYGLFITNLSDAYSTNSVYTIYRLRWQVELIFKSWKSILDLHKIHSAKENRILCEVYGKLIVAILLMGVCNEIQNKYEVPFSYFQLLQYFKAIATNWSLKIMAGLSRHSTFLKKITKQIVRFCQKRKQKTRERIEDLLGSLCYSSKKMKKMYA